MPGAGPGSKVAITVGEQNGFFYTVTGETSSPYRIAVSGDYFNDEARPYRGYVNLFLAVDPGIYGYYRYDFIKDNILQIRIWNRVGSEFIFKVTSPWPVYADQLYHEQFNATSVRVGAPSRSQA